MNRRYAKYPPRRICDTCGGHFYKWSGIDCDKCVAERAAKVKDGESWRAFRKRVIEGK